MAIAEITAALTSIKIAKDMVKGIASLDSDIAIKSKSSELLNVIVELQEHILSMQSQYSELLQSENNLKKKLAELESWNQ